MKAINIPLFQTITNKANQRLDFTHDLRRHDGRYVVSYKSIYTGKNPSLDSELCIKISDVLQNEGCHSIGGWLDKDTYYLDCNLHFNYLKDAVTFAKLNDQIAIFDKVKNEVIIVKGIEL